MFSVFHLNCLKTSYFVSGWLQSSMPEYLSLSPSKEREREVESRKGEGGGREGGSVRSDNINSL